MSKPERRIAKQERASERARVADFFYEHSEPVKTATNHHVPVWSSHARDRLPAIRELKEAVAMAAAGVGSK